MIYRHIRELREDSDKTQKELGAVLGVAQNTYSQYETGVIAFTDEMLVRLADYYSTSVDYLLDRTENKVPYAKR